MKMIIAPTDFSKTARNAINYAAEIARRKKAKLVLLHACHPPVMIADAAVILPLPADIEKDCMKRLKRMRLDLITRFGRGLHVEAMCLNGLAADVIAEQAKSHKADLIVVGTQGVGYLEEKLIGSVTSELIKNSRTPVLSIAPKVRYKNIKKILLATDYEHVENKAALDPLKELAGLYKSHIYILNVTDQEKRIPTLSQAVQGIKLEHLLEEQDHSFHTITNQVVVDGINEFAKTYRMDMIVMLPRHRSFMQSIFKKRNTKAMAFHTETPLLTIHI